jgi:hypothetical protein
MGIGRHAAQVVCGIFALLVSASCTVRGPVPVEQEPRHALVFENADLRVLDVRIPPGESTLAHRHANDLLSVCLSPSEVRTRMPSSDWDAVGPRRQMGDASLTEYTGKPGTHTAQNVGADPYRLIAVENLGTTWSEKASATAPDMPVLQDGRAFQALAIEFTATIRRVQRLHAVPVVVVLTHGAVSIERSDAALQGLEANTPWAVIPAGVPFALNAKDDREARVVEIQVR